MSSHPPIRVGHRCQPCRGAAAHDAGRCLAMPWWAVPKDGSHTPVGPYVSMAAAVGAGDPGYAYVQAWTSQEAEGIAVVGRMAQMRLFEGDG